MSLPTPYPLPNAGELQFVLTLGPGTIRCLSILAFFQGALLVCWYCPDAAEWLANIKAAWEIMKVVAGKTKITSWNE